MSVAKSIKEFEPKKMDWLAVEDDLGHIWRYRRVGGSDLAEACHVEGHFSNGQPLRASLIRDVDGHVLLRQDGSKLPNVLFVQYIDDPNSVFLTALGLPGKAEYVLVA